MELKYISKLNEMARKMRLNRTFMELKLRFLS